MSKSEYMRRLEDCLRYRLSREQIADILRDYQEYFEEGAHEGKSDEEICQRLGMPNVVADQIIGELSGKDSYRPYQSTTINVQSSSNESKMLKTIVIILFVVIASPILLAAAGILFGIVIALLCLILAGIITVIAGLWSIGFFPPSMIALVLFGGLTLFCGSLTLFLLVIWAVRKICQHLGHKRQAVTNGGWEEQQNG